MKYTVSIKCEDDEGELDSHCTVASEYMEYALAQAIAGTSVMRKLRVLGNAAVYLADCYGEASNDNSDTPFVKERMFVDAATALDGAWDENDRELDEYISKQKGNSP